MLPCIKEMPVCHKHEPHHVQQDTQNEKRCLYTVNKTWSSRSSMTPSLERADGICFADTGALAFLLGMPSTVTAAAVTTAISLSALMITGSHRPAKNDKKDLEGGTAE